MEIKRSKKVHMVVQEEPKRKAPKIPPKEPDPRDEFYKKIYAPNLSAKDLVDSLRSELEGKLKEEQLKRVDNALVRLEEAQRRNTIKAGTEKPGIIETNSYDIETNSPNDEIELFKKVPGAPVPKGLSYEKLKEMMVSMSTITGRTTNRPLPERERQIRSEAQLENARMTPELYWVTGDGRRIMITEMEDLHLTNTIKYFLKKLNKELAFYVSDKYRQLYNRYNITERSTMTADDFLKELNELEDLGSCKEAFKRFPKLKNLLSESMKRGLNWGN